MLKTSCAFGCPFSCFFFCFVIFSHIPIHYYVLWYFNSSEVDSWSLIRVNPGSHISYIIFQSCLILLRYLYTFFPKFLSWNNVFPPQNDVCCSLGGNVPIWFFNTLLLYYNHRIICPNLLYLDTCNVVVCYPIGFFSFGSNKDVYGGNTCLVVSGKAGSTEGG